MTNNCTPAGVVPVVDDPCAMLGALRAALYALMAGQARFEIRNGDQWLSFQRGDAQRLQHEVRRLEMICTQGPKGRAVRVGPIHPHYNNRPRRFY
jgi:hypothetical protein